MTFLEAAESVLRETRTPLHYEEITKLALAKGFIVTKDTLRRHLANLVERGLVARSGNIYQISQNGLTYLERVRHEGPPSSTEPSEFQALYEMAEQQRQGTRDKLAEQLTKIDPIQFEHLIRRLLEEMSYQNVEVTSPTNDKGVDVVANIELGITAVREVI